MARQLNATCNFNIGYLICDILENTMEVVVKMKTTFGKHTLVEDQKRRRVKYRPWGRHNQPKIKMDTKKRVTLVKVRKMRRDSMELVTSSDSSTWVPEGEGFGYPPKRFTNPSYQHTNEEEGQKEHPHDENDGDATPEDHDNTNELMPRE